jgi:hypothetical protein
MLPRYPLKMVDIEHLHPSNQVPLERDEWYNQHYDSRIGKRTRQHKQETFSGSSRKNGDNLFRLRHDRSKGLLLLRASPVCFLIAIEFP